MEVRRGCFRRDDRDVVGKGRVERLRGPFDRRPAVDVDADDVRECVDAGVRPARDGEVMQMYIYTGVDGCKRTAHLILHRAQARLRRPPSKAGAVVGDR